MGPGTVYSEESTFEGGVVSCTSLHVTHFSDGRTAVGSRSSGFVFEQVVKLLIDSQNLGIFSAISRSRYMQERLEFFYHDPLRNRRIRIRKRKGNH